MIRKIIVIDENKCNGCGICADACHEGAIQIIDNKAKLIREDYCDGLGDCLPTCPTDAISFEEREAAAYDYESVQIHLQKRSAKAPTIQSELSQWPVQIRLASIQASFFENADLLIAADCAAYSYGNFHHDFIKGKVTLIGCPKLDSEDYSEKLSQILKAHTIKSITVTRMEVPCCGGMEVAVKKAIQISGKDIPCQIVVISTTGIILSR